MSMEMTGQNDDSWTRFASTGRVEDYLKYRTEIRNSSGGTDSGDKDRNDDRKGYIYGDDNYSITDQRMR